MLNSPTDVGMNITDYPGQRYNADKQCQIIYGPESFYCAVSSAIPLLQEHQSFQYRHNFV